MLIFWVFVVCGFLLIVLIFKFDFVLYSKIYINVKILVVINKLI